MKKLSDKWIIKNRDLKIPKFYSIEYENFSKNYQTEINEKICQINGLSKIEI